MWCVKVLRLGDVCGTGKNDRGGEIKMRSWLAKKLGFLSNTRRVQHEVDATKVLLLTELFRRHRLVAATGGSRMPKEQIF